MNSIWLTFENDLQQNCMLSTSCRGENIPNVPHRSAAGVRKIQMCRIDLRITWVRIVCSQLQNMLPDRSNGSRERCDARALQDDRWGPGSNRRSISKSLDVELAQVDIKRFRSIVCQSPRKSSIVQCRLIFIRFGRVARSARAAPGAARPVATSFSKRVLAHSEGLCD